jgi:hypothetical protein
MVYDSVPEFGRSFTGGREFDAVADLHLVKRAYVAYLEKMLEEARQVEELLETSTPDRMVASQDFQTIALAEASSWSQQETGRPTVMIGEKPTFYNGLGGRTLELLHFNLAVSDRMKDKSVLYVGSGYDFQIIEAWDASKYIFIDKMIELQHFDDYGKKFSAFRDKDREGKIQLVPHFVVQSADGRWNVENGEEIPRAEILYSKCTGIGGDFFDWYVEKARPECIITEAFGSSSPRYHDATGELIDPRVPSLVEKITESFTRIHPFCFPYLYRVDAR